MSQGVVAAGHPLTAEAGAGALRDGGTAVDAALAAMLAAFVAEPELTGLGAGGYMLVGTPAGEAVLIDFFVEAPGREPGEGPRTDLIVARVMFGDVAQVFRCGPASCGTYGMPAGVAAAHHRFGTLPLERLAEPAIRMAREGVVVNAQQAYVAQLLAPITGSSEEARSTFWVDGRPVREGDRQRLPELADGIERLAREGAEPFYRGDIAARVAAWVSERGGALGTADLAAYAPIDREPVRVAYRGREVLTNPPPSAGGILLAHALAQLEQDAGPPDTERLLAAMERTQAERTPRFLEGLAEPGFLDEFMARRLGSTTHVSAMDDAGWACSVTVTNGVGSGVVVPGTGVHVNNMLGEQDLNPLGFFTHPPGRRLPSMMAPTLVRRGGTFELAVGSAGSNRIRSAILQVIVNAIDAGMDACEAIAAPRVHWEDGITYVEPGVDFAPLEAAGRTVARFEALNLYFGGAQAVERDARTGLLSGGGDPRRGGAVVSVP